MSAQSFQREGGKDHENLLLPHSRIPASFRAGVVVHVVECRIKSHFVQERALSRVKSASRGVKLNHPGLMTARKKRMTAKVAVSVDVEYAPWHWRISKIRRCSWC